MNLCPGCKARPKQKHHNSKWCLPCAKERRKRPRSTLSAAQKRWVKERIGKMPVTEMAERLGTSVSNVKRAFRGKSLWFHNGKLKNNPKLVKQVLDYYSAHGWHATEKAFPNLRIKSIIHRADYFGFKLKPRQARWKEHEIILAARMAGLVDGKRQARIFNRPGANEGSIKSLWMKRFGHGGGNIHGMSEWMAKHLLKPGYPVLKTRVWSKRKGQPDRGPVRGLVLWCDMDGYLKPDVPAFVRDGVQAMAEFQCWLFETRKPKRAILEILKLAETK